MPRRKPAPTPQMTEERIGGWHLPVYWPDPDTGPLRIEGHWVLRDGRPECVGLEIYKGVTPLRDRSGYQRPKGSAPMELTALDVRLPVATIVEALWGLVAEKAGQQAVYNRMTLEDHDYSPEVKASIERDADRGETRSKLQRGQRPLQEVAAVYADAMRKPGRKRPTEAVKEHFNVSHSTATKWVREARESGLLPVTSPGRPSGRDPR